MGTSTIQIPVDSDLARLYQNASPEEQRKIQVLLHLFLREMSEPSSLSQIMDSISDKAQERGLTSDLLESLLDSNE